MGAAPDEIETQYVIKILKVKMLLCLGFASKYLRGSEEW